MHPAVSGGYVLANPLLYVMRADPTMGTVTLPTEVRVMETMSMETLRSSSDVLFLMLGAVMVFAMHAGFAFLEVGTVRQKNQVNALVKILDRKSVV